MRSLLLGLFVGALHGAGLVALLEFMDNTVKPDMDIQGLTGAPVLATISAISKLQPGGRQVEALGVGARQHVQRRAVGGPDGPAVERDAHFGGPGHVRAAVERDAALGQAVDDAVEERLRQKQASLRQPIAGTRKA